MSCDVKLHDAPETHVKERIEFGVVSDDDDESLMSSSDEEDESSKKVEIAIAPQKCVFYRHLQFREADPLPRAVAKAALDLDEVKDGNLQRKDVWSNMLNVLKASIGSKNLQGRRKSNQISRLTSDVVMMLDRSQDRTLARLDVLFDTQNTKEVFAALTGPEKKCFNACMQLWRKHFRDHNLTFTGTLECRLTTCIEASKLLTRQRSTFMYCSALGERGISSSVEYEDDLKGWTSFVICCRTTLEMREAMDSILPFLAPGINVTTIFHDDTSTSVKGTLPPSMYLGDARLHDNLRGTHRSSTLDSTAVYKVILDAQDYITQSSQAPLSLTAASAWACSIYANAKMLNGLVDHLDYLVRHVYRCASCDKAICAPASLPADLSSFETAQAAAKAGFDVRPAKESAFRQAIRVGSYWVPSFREPMLALKDIETLDPFRRHNPQLLESVGRDGSASKSTFYFGECDETGDRSNTHMRNTWRFCLPCCSAHLGVPGIFMNVVCRCRVCKYERTLDPLVKPDDNIKIRFNSIWSRDVLSS